MAKVSGFFQPKKVGKLLVRLYFVLFLNLVAEFVLCLALDLYLVFFNLNFLFVFCFWHASINQTMLIAVQEHVYVRFLLRFVP